MPARDPGIEERLKEVLQDPAIRGASPNQMISNISNALGIGDLEPTSQEDINAVLAVYFQAFKLRMEMWTLMGPFNFIQTVPFRLRKMPPGGQLVADVLIDKSDFERECFDRFIKQIDVRGQTIVFTARQPLPVDLTIGLKCTDENDNILAIPDEDLRPAH